MAQQTYGEWMRSNPPIPNQTAVEWFMDKLHASSAYKNMDMKDWNKIVNIYEKARQKEMEQIKKAWNNSKHNKWGTENTIISAEHYYNETYGIGNTL